MTLTGLFISTQEVTFPEPHILLEINLIFLIYDFQPQRKCFQGLTYY